MLTVYFGTPSMFITLWFGFDYGTNPPLGKLIIWQVHLCACIWKCCVYVGKHGHKGRLRNKFKGAFTESCSCSWVWWNQFQWWQGPKCYEVHPRGLKRKRPNFMRGEPPSWTRGWHRQNHASGGAKCIITWGTTGAKGRPNRAEMGLGRSAQAGRPSPLRGSVRPPFPCTRRIFNPKTMEAPPFDRGRAIRTRRPSTS
jgi:hypothetical protein